MAKSDSHSNGDAVPDEFDIETVLAAKRPNTVDATVTLDDTTDPPRTAVFKFAAMGRIAWENLLGEHPASDEQQAEARADQLEQGVPPSRIQKLRWNVETFPPALIARCAVSPKLTIEQARRMWDDPAWNSAELDKLFSAALVANESPNRVRLGKDYETILASAGL